MAEEPTNLNTTPFAGNKDSKLWNRAGNPNSFETMLINWLDQEGSSNQSTVLSKIINTLSKTNSYLPKGSKSPNDLIHLQGELRRVGLSKAKGALGIFTPQDISALTNATKQAIAYDTSIFTVLGAQGAQPGKVLKKPDTTTRYNKNIQTALRYKDIGDAQFALNNSYFAEFGYAPSIDIQTKFRTAWNNEERAQEGKVTVTTSSVTRNDILAPKVNVYTTNKKGKKVQVFNKDGSPKQKQPVDMQGNLVYAPQTKGTTVTTGEGFTKGEMDEFLAKYISENAPKEGFDAKTIGGAAKGIYDLLNNAHLNNYDDMPDFATLSPIIKQALSSSDEKVRTEITSKYTNGIRKSTAAKYMGIAEYLNSGEDASTYIKPLLARASNFLEEDININDNFMKKALNFQGSDGKYRLMNEFELQQALMQDSRYGKTSAAKNEMVNVFQSLTGGLR